MYSIYTVIYSLKKITSDSLLHNTFINYRHRTTHETDDFCHISTFNGKCIYYLSCFSLFLSINIDRGPVGSLLTPLILK